MPDEIRELRLRVGDRDVRALETGTGSRLVLVLHGGTPGLSSFAASADTLRGLLERLDLDGHRVVAPDLPGAGGTPARSVEDLTVGGTIAFARELIAALAPNELHLVGHGDASLATLALARDEQLGVAVSSCALLAPVAAAPTSDGLDNIALLHPPAPRWSRRSQRWALDRLCFSAERGERELLDACVEHARGAAHRGAVARLEQDGAKSEITASVYGAMDAFYAYCREVRYAVPLTLVWGADDPTAEIQHAAVLNDIVGEGPAPVGFHLIDRCGHFPHVDQPDRVARTVGSAIRRAVRVEVA